MHGLGYHRCSLCHTFCVFNNAQRLGKPVAQLWSPRRPWPTEQLAHSTCICADTKPQSRWPRRICLSRTTSSLLLTALCVVTGRDLPATDVAGMSKRSSWTGPRMPMTLVILSLASGLYGSSLKLRRGTSGHVQYYCCSQHQNCRWILT